MRHLTLALRNERGTSIISNMIAAAIIVGAISAVVFPAMKLQSAIKKTEIANLAVMIESNLVDSFNNKLNYPDDTALTTALRGSTLPTAMTLTTSFHNLSLTRGTGGFLSASGFLSRTMAACTGYSYDCVIKYEVRLGKSPTGSFAFSYQVEANPDVISMAPIGKLATYPTTAPTNPEELLTVDPGLYRVVLVKNLCDPTTDIFMNGMNRDTGEAFCVEKPLTTKCAEGHLPKGLVYTEYSGRSKAGKLEFVCGGELRRHTCQRNYGLQSFSPQALDPAMPVQAGACVFRTAQTSSMAQAFPANPRSPYVRQVSGTFCPPYYKAGGASSCQLVEDATRNATLNVGSAKCADTAYKDCSRNTYRYELRSDGGAARATWDACMPTWTARLATEPWRTWYPGYTAEVFCGSRPNNPEWVNTNVCNTMQYSRYCNGTVTSGGTYCSGGSDSGWSSGTPYATNIRVIAPSASANSSFSGRRQTCTLQDTSPACTAPNLDFNGNTWGKGNPKWYGGIQVTGTTCSLDIASYPENVTSAVGP